MIKLKYVSATILLAAAALAHAETAAPQPGGRSLAGPINNVGNIPDNKGLHKPNSQNESNRNNTTEYAAKRIEQPGMQTQKKSQVDGSRSERHETMGGAPRFESRIEQSGK